jgi:protocatechuate 3,4-dioxygenase beta subunit
MERRTFLGNGLGLGLATLAAPKWLLGQACPETQPDRYGKGPFYLEGAPERNTIGLASEPGEKLSLSGTVSNCREPLAGIRLEVWQATASGCYVFPQAHCDLTDGDDSEARLWATLVSDAAGRFAFDTIKPGRYLNGDRYRPSHIHFRISTPGRSAEQGGLDLVTQLYFEGDEYIPGDYAADHPSAAGRIIPLSRAATGPWEGTFDINLPGMTAGLGRDPLSDPGLAAFDVVVQRRGHRVLFHLPPAPRGEAVELRLFAADGSLIRRGLHRTVPIEVDATFLPKGVYQADFRWWTPHGLRREKARLGL